MKQSARAVTAGRRRSAIGLEYRLRLATLAVVSAVSVALTEAARGPLVPLALLGVLLVAAVLSVFPGRSESRGLLPRWLILSGALAAFAGAVYEIGLTGAPAVLALGHFFMLILILKLVDRAGARDDAELLVTSLFLMVIGAIISGSLAYGALLAVYVAVGIGAMFDFEVRREQAAMRELARAVAAEPTFVGVVARWRPVGRAYVYAALGVVVATGLSVFVLAPRVGVGMLGSVASPMPVSVTGFSDRVEFGDIAEIKTSSRPVMRVELLLNGHSIGSADRQPYFRAMALDIYDGRNWHKMPGTDSVRVRSGSPLIPGYAPAPNEPVLEQRYRLMRSNTNYLFTAGLPCEMQFDGPQRVLLRQSDRALMLEGRRPPPNFSYTVLSVMSRPPALSRALDRSDDALPAWAIHQPYQYAGLDSRYDPRRVVSPRVRDYAHELVRELSLPNSPEAIRRIAERIERHLLSGEFGYTLDQSDVDRSAEPMEDFLLRRQRGHCEYFAGAMAILCQLAGVNARVVNGYRGGEWVPAGEYYIVREEHAHSWVEVHTGEAWERFDPTPGSANVASAGDTWWAQVRGLLRHLQTLWADNVVAYTATSRENLLAAFGSWLVGLGEQGSLPAELLYAMRELLLGPAALTLGYRLLYWMMVALMLLAVYMVIRLLLRPARRAWRWLRRSRPGGRRPPADEAFYVGTLELLRERGHVPPPTQTPMEFMSNLAAADPRFVRLPEVAAAYYQVHFGGRTLEAGQRQRVESIIRSLRSAPHG